MLTNYLTVAVRTFLRNKGYSALTLLSLALGLTATLLILLYLDVAFFKVSQRSLNSSQLLLKRLCVRQRCIRLVRGRIRR